MNVGLIIYGSLNTVSGGYMYDRYLVRALRERGHTVQILSLPWRTYAHHLGHNLSSQLRAKLLSSNVDLWLQDELNHPSLVLINRQLRRRAPVLSIVHHLRQDEAHPRPLKLLYQLVENAYIKSVHGFIFNSQTTQKRVQEISGHWTPGTVAYPGADHLWDESGNSSPATLPSPATIRARARTSGPLRVLFIGNLIPRKRVDTLLLALSHLPTGTITLDIVGRSDISPRYTRHLRRLIRQHDLHRIVRLHNYLPIEAVKALLAHAHVLAIPSQYEGFGIAYLEGMAFGLPALAGNRGAAHEIITHGKNGYLLAPDDILQWATCLHHLHTHRDSLADMGIAAQKRYLNHPTWKESMTQAATWLESQFCCREVRI